MNITKSKYENAIDILTSQGKFYINLGLERVQKILELLGNPQDKLKYIHVAGTNGKGSVCAILSSILSYKPYPSPLRGEGGRSSDEGVFAFKKIYSKDALEKAKLLRKKVTDTEKILWFYLRNRRLGGLKFRRQVPIGRYIADFACKEKKIIVELDGSGHLSNRQIEHDRIRDSFLKSEGYCVLRVYNDDIFNRIDNVLEYIFQSSICPLTPAKRALSTMGRGIKDLKVGLFTSPHVFEYTERIKINNIEIGKEYFAKGINDIIKLADENDIHLTEFEILTVLAFNYFAQNNVDIVVLETGLGGRLDATNVIKKPICSIITHIDFDHTERLGDTIEKIAFEKAGIIKGKCPVIISKKNAGFETIKRIAVERNSETLVCNEAPNFLLENLALKGVYQKENLALALQTIEVLNKNEFNITQAQIEAGLKEVKHPCRFEYIKENNIIIDGAHNPDGTKALRESLDYYFPNQNFKFIFGCLKTKDYPAMIKSLFTPNDDIYFYEFDNQNACKYSDLSTVCKYKSKPFSEFVQDKNTLTVICGSFYMLKELLTKLA